MCVGGHFRCPCWPIDEDAGVLRREIAVGGEREIVARRGEQALEIPLAHAPVAECFPFGEIVGLPFHVLEAANPA